jgi:hypothetical protein
MFDPVIPLAKLCDVERNLSKNNYQPRRHSKLVPLHEILVWHLLANLTYTLPEYECHLGNVLGELMRTL